MKTIKISEFGKAHVLKEYKEERPKIKKENDVLIKSFSAGINPLDIKKRNGELQSFYGKELPMGIGNDVVGEIVEISSKNKKFQVGDLVYCMVDSGENNPLSGFSSGSAYSEYCITKDYTIASIPKNTDVRKLSAVPLAALTALQGLIKCNYSEKKSILINGASGGVGLFALQFAKISGLEVHTISNEKAFPLLKQLGSAVLYNYRNENKEYLNNSYDIIFDVAANMKYSKIKKSLNNGGIYISNVASFSLLLNEIVNKMFIWIKTRRMKTYNWVRSDGHLLEKITKIIDENDIRLIIDKEFKLNEAHKAHEYVENNSIIGKVILSINQSC